jgi:hypothetical protein
MYGFFHKLPCPSFIHLHVAFSCQNHPQCHDFGTTFLEQQNGKTLLVSAEWEKKTQNSKKTYNQQMTRYSAI